MTDIILALRNISKNFGGLSVVSDVTFDVPRGSRLALIGPNGAGKTTIFNIISGFYQPETGDILLNNAPIQMIPSRKRIGLGIARSFQNIRLMPHLSVIENIMLGQQAQAGSLIEMLKPLSEIAQSHWRQEAESLLEEMDLYTYRGEVVSTLPYGIRKKIELVRALAAHPKLLLLDEPAAGLNAMETSNLTDFLLRISASGVTLLVVEHDMGLVRKLCEQVIVLNFGRKIYDGPTAQVQNDPLVLEAYLGPRNAPACREATDAA